VADLITPLIAAIFGKQDFSSLTFTINGSTFRYGDFINALITFLIIAAVVFFFVVRPMNTLMARLKRPDEEPDAPSAEVATLLEIRDLLATQRGGGVA